MLASVRGCYRTRRKGARLVAGRIEFGVTLEPYHPSARRVYQPVALPQRRIEIDSQVVAGIGA